MTIRLTSVEAFEKVLEKLKQDLFYSAEANETFFKYCVDTIKEGLVKGDDEWYLDVEWMYDQRVGKVASIFRYHKHSDIPTDVEYLTPKSDEDISTMA